MIKIVGNKMVFTGDDFRRVKHIAKKSGLPFNTFVTGCLWEQVMRDAREGKFTKKKKTLRT